MAMAIGQQAGYICGRCLRTKSRSRPVRNSASSVLQTTSSRRFTSRFVPVSRSSLANAAIGPRRDPDNDITSPVCPPRSSGSCQSRNQLARNVTSRRATTASASISAYSLQSRSYYSTLGSSASPPPGSPPKSRTPSFDREVAQLAALPLHPLTLTDLVRFGKPPLAQDLLLASAAFTLRVLPIRIARRIIALRNLPYIVVSNPHISQIYNNYLHSLRLLLSFPKHDFPTTLKEEARFNDVLSEIVDTHRNTIPALAKGFTECKRYVKPEQITSFLEEHLRARIGTRLLAEQHLALHDASISQGRQLPGVPGPESTYIGTIDTHLNPTTIVKYCAEFVGDICDVRYGLRPSVIVDGMTDAKFAYVPSHLEYILTELLKNAFRATIEKGNEDIPIIITIASAEMGTQDVEDPYYPTIGGFGMLENGSGGEDGVNVVRPGTDVQGDGLKGDVAPYSPNKDVSAGETMKAEAARAITIRIRDRGGGIAPEHLPHIFNYSFTTFNSASTLGGSGGYTSNVSGGDSGGMGMDAISSAMNDVEGSTIAGLGFGMGLSRSYAQFFGGDLKVESLFGWGTDVYLGFRGLDIDR